MKTKQKMGIPANPPTARNTQIAEKPIVELVANVEDEAAHKAYNVYRIVKVGGDAELIELERSKALDFKKFEQALIDANAELPYDSSERRKLLDTVAQSQPPELRLNAAHVGWRELGHSFIFFNRGCPNQNRLSFCL